MPAEILTQAQAKALHAGPWPEGIDVRTELALEALASGEVVAVSAASLQALRHELQCCINLIAASGANGTAQTLAAARTALSKMEAA